MKHKTLIGASIAVAVALLLGGFIFTYQGSPKEIVAVADQFQPPTNWELTDERIVPPAFMCLEANCPSVHRSWKTDGILTKEQFHAVLNNSGWDFTIVGECTLNPNVSGSIPLCSAEGVDGQYRVSTTAWGSDRPGDSRFILSIDE